MVRYEWILTLALFLIGAGFTVESLRLGLGSIHRPGIGFLPFYTGLGMSGVALAFFLKTFLAVKRQQEAEREKTDGLFILRVAVIFAALVLYVLLVPVLGFLIGTFLLLIFLFKAGGIRRWMPALLAALVSVWVSYLLFSFW